MRLALWASLISLPNCTDGGGYTSATGTDGRMGVPTTSSTTAGGTTAGGSVQGTGSTGTGQSSGGSTSGSTTGGVADCTPDESACPPGGELTLNACPEGQVEVAGNAVDYCQMEQPVWCTVSCSDIYDQALQTVGDGCGYFHFCVAPNTPIHMTIAAAGYLTLDFATILAPASTELPAAPGIPMVCTSVYVALTGGLPTFNPDLPALLVNVYPLANQHGSSLCSNTAGWSFALELPDGGGPISSSVAYQSGVSLSTTDDVTSTEGFVLFFNIDPVITSVRLAGTNPSLALSDGGTICPNIPGAAPFYLTGEVALQPSHASYMPYLIPAP